MNGRLILMFLMITSSMLLITNCNNKSGGSAQSSINEKQITGIIEKLVDTYGENHRDRIDTGVHQAASFWRKEDGTQDEFKSFCLDHFIADPEVLQLTADRFEKNMESVNGLFTEMRRDLKEPLDLNLGPVLNVDYQFAQFTPWSHTNEDYFKTKIAFSVLLNFPQYSLEESLKLGPDWSRQQWAQARLAGRFGTRIPSEAGQIRNTAYTNADDYIANYNIYMHHVLTEDGKRLFPKGMRLITHWNLRDELKSRYADSEGLAHQETIQTIMERIITQEIPEVVIDNPAVDWKIATNTVTPSAVTYEGITQTDKVNNNPEPNTRYYHLLETFKAERVLDPYYPNLPTKIDRRFQKNREIPEAKVEELFTTLLKSDAFKATGQRIAKRLGRELRPFDIWYTGFAAKSNLREDALDKIVSRKYPTPKAFEKDIPNMLRKLGFSSSRAKFLASKVTVDPARGIGHAMGAGRRADNAHLRTRIPESGMNYKGYNIAVHELGHNIEQVISLNLIDHTLLEGVPNTAFTEAFAFVFQARDRELLGLKYNNTKGAHMNALHNLWSTCEIAGVSLVDMRVWRWMYENPNVKPAELKAAVIQIAKDVWNEYFEPVFGHHDTILLGIYSHMIDGGMYLPDYPLGHIIAFQIEHYLEDKKIGPEMERMCKLGSITPDAWMQAALGEPISVEPMLKAATEALLVL